MTARPDTWKTMVRPGIALYGYSLAFTRGGEPAAVTPLPLRPVLSWKTRVLTVKEVGAGEAVGYMGTFVTMERSRIAVLPVGYADGLPRSATNTAQVLAAGRRHTIAGTVCMNQFVLDLGDTRAAAGDEVVLFGPGEAGEPTAQDWADALGTISYEIVIGFGGRWARSYRGVTYGAGVP